ncbi:MAG: hypothetical protein O7H41_17550 [Planctomycetota bacterium]|nr:hypothetical protein [Planctomycetota bacterium]
MDSAWKPWIRACVTLAFLWSLLGTAQAHGSDWTIQVVDPDGGTGALAYDTADGHPSVAYYTKSVVTKGKKEKHVTEMMFAHWDGSAWQTESVDSRIGSGDKTADIAYDATGAPTLAYAWNIGEVTFARFDGSSWGIETVDNEQDVNGISLAYDADGSPAVSYVARVRKTLELKFARWTESGWDVETVDDDLWSPERRLTIFIHDKKSSLAFDPNTGDRTIAYSARTGDSQAADTLRFARWNGSTWEIEDVHRRPDLFPLRDPSHAYDPLDGRPSIAWASGTGPEGTVTVQLAHWNGSAWDKESVEVRAWASSLAYDSDVASPDFGTPGATVPPDAASARSPRPRSHVRALAIGWADSNLIGCRPWANGVPELECFW